MLLNTVTCQLGTFFEHSAIARTQQLCVPSKFWSLFNCINPSTNMLKTTKVYK